VKIFQNSNTIPNTIRCKLYLSYEFSGRCWRPRWNNELYSLYKEPNIVEGIKIRRLGLAGNIIRMEEESIPKRALNGHFRTTRPVERPRTRWANVVQRDALQLLGIRKVKLQIGINGGVLWGRPGPGRGCSAIYGSVDKNLPLLTVYVYCGRYTENIQGKLYKYDCRCVIHSSLCVLNFTLLACRTNFGKFSRKIYLPVYPPCFSRFD
jgi:hypothetical protein